MKTIVGVTGATTVGKSAVGVELARELCSEVISADSMQVYKGMDVGTAKISLEEMQGVKHHMIDVATPNQNYSSFLYQQQASRIIDALTTLPVVVGGTGFYFDSLIYPPEFACFNEERRVELKQILVEQGVEGLQRILKKLDPQAYDTIDLSNPKRVMRAIEIAEGGNSLLSGAGRVRQPKYDLKLFVLERPRDSLYKQIDLRVDKMIKDGLVDEVKAIVMRYGVCDTSAFQAIGYKEVIEFLNGKISLIDAIDKIKLNTRHYAKRQITYFKRMNVTQYIDVEGKSARDITMLIAEALGI